jgi:hypothetical protein
MHMRANYWFLYLLNICFILLAEFVKTGPMRLQICLLLLFDQAYMKNHDENVIIAEILDHRRGTLCL